MIKTLASILLFGGTISLGLADGLYLLTGSPTPVNSESFASVLYTLTRGTNTTLVKVREVMPLTEFILEEPINRILVLADLNLRRKRIEIISENSPADGLSIDVPQLKDGWFVNSLTVLRPSSGEAVLGLGLFRRAENGLMEHDLWGVTLNSPDKSLKRLTPELLKHAVAGGRSGLADIGTGDTLTTASRKLGELNENSCFNSCYLDDRFGTAHYR